MKPHEEAAPAPDGDRGDQHSRVDERMAGILRDKTPVVREQLRQESTEEAEDLLGRLNAMDFIDSVIGESVDLPEKIGHYRIIGVLGHGGMGTVYKAHQEDLDREVALKVLAPRFSSDPTMRERFRKEAKATAAMHHLNIVPIYGYGEASGHLFFAMEMVPGVSLDKYVAVARRRGEGPMEPRDAARRFAGVADALALAHARQILHRDVKPGNLLVHPDGTLALADFGLSKFLGEASVHLTSVGGFLGTLHYSSPEQARGETVGPASDLYSLGVTLFQCLTGELPLKGESTEAALQSLLNDEPTRLRSVLPKASRDLEAVVAKLLHKDPLDRYQDGKSLALDLTRVAEGEPVRIRREGLIKRAYRRAKRNPVMSSAVGIVIVLLVVTGLWFRQWLISNEFNREQEGRQHLDAAGVAMANEEGTVSGPFGILNVLSGAESADPEAVEGTQFLTELNDAEARLPAQTDDFSRYRLSYEGTALSSTDGAPSPLDLLRSGNGMGAIRELTARINGIKDRYSTQDMGAQMDLYFLHLARAMANVTASVTQPQEAINDLNLATFLRQGSILPRLLRTFLTWTGDGRPEQLLRDLRGLVDVDDPFQRRSIAELLLAFSGEFSPSGSHLMRFPMSYDTRKQLATQALEWLGNPPQRDSGGYYGLDHQMADYAREVFDNLGNQPAMKASFESARSVLASSVAQASPLRSWHYTFYLMGDEETEIGALDSEQLTGGALNFVKLVQAELPIPRGENLLRESGPQLTKLLGENADLAEASASLVELRARFSSWVGDDSEASSASDAWLKLDPTDPEANLCKFTCLVRAVPAGEDEWFDAVVSGSTAVDLALDGARLRTKVKQRVAHQIATLEAVGTQSQWLQKLLDDFSQADGKGDER